MLVLVRHGQSVANAEQRVCGRIESPLTADGVAQVHLVAAKLARDSVGSAPGAKTGEVRGSSATIGKVVSSPLGRAIATAEVIAAELGVSAVEVDDRWVEMDYGDIDGMLLSEVPPQLWRSWRLEPSYRPPGAETLDEVGRRTVEACVELIGEEGSPGRLGDVIVVSHVSPIKAAVAWALGTGFEVSWRLHLSTAAITRIGWAHGAAVLHSFNESPNN